MGVFDIDGLYRDKNLNFGLHGDGNVAATHMKRVHRIVEKMQGVLDLGHNEGMQTSQFQLTNDTRVFVKVTPGVDMPIWRVDIVSNPEAPPEEPLPPGNPEIEEICPVLPLGSPGNRMFSQLLGNDVVAGQVAQGFTHRKVPIFQTPYIEPTLEQGHYCNEGAEQRHGQIILNTPFRFGGADVSVCYVHWGWVGFTAPNVGMNFIHSNPARESPCTIDAPGFPATTPDIDDLTPGNSGVISMVGNVSNPCQSLLEDQCTLIEGKVTISQRLAQGAEEDDTAENEYPFSLVAGEGDVRDVSIFSFHSQPGGSLNTGEREIVLLHPSEQCPSAIGLFYGGDDGRYPWSHSDGPFFLDALDAPAPCKGSYLTSLLCKVAEGEGDDYAGPTCGLPVNYGGLIIGGERQAYAWIGGEKTFAETNEAGAKLHLNSRAFWFHLDVADGIPNGNGLHNGALQNGEEMGATSFGTGDLGFP